MERGGERRAVITSLSERLNVGGGGGGGVIRVARNLLRGDSDKFEKLAAVIQILRQIL